MSAPSPFADPLRDPILGDAGMAALFAPAATIQSLLDVEAALAAVQADLGLIPAEAAPAIAAACRAELYDPVALGMAAAEAGNIAIPLVKALTATVEGSARGHVHWGATSQDVIDTALVLQIRAALARLDADLFRLGHALAGLARTHRASVMPARTWLQQALPTTFGLKVAGWLDAVTRQRARLRAAAPRLLALQFGGAAGTLASLGTVGPAVASALATRLDLTQPATPWHTHRDRIAEAGALCGLLTGTLGKIARDVSLMMQTEIGEAMEPAAPGRGGSSTLPHKRNPILCGAILAAATAAPGLVATLMAAQVQEHERAAGPWSAEWRALPDLVILTGGALARAITLAEGLTVDTARMRSNLDATEGLILAEAAMMALAPTLGRDIAHAVVEAASRRALAEGRSLRATLAEAPELVGRLDAASLDRVFDPSAYLGAADAFLDAALAAHDALSAEAPPPATGDDA